jgi:type I restriction enzyme S subunit
VLKDYPFLLAPLAEQRRIVDKIEELFSELDKGVEALSTAREQLKAYRQSVLKHAFEGKLTESWRSRHPEKALAPAERLACIRAAAKARF